VKKTVLICIFLLQLFLSFGQTTLYNSIFDYKNINIQTFIPMTGWSNEQKHMLTILKHSFEMQQIVNQPKDTLFWWNGLTGKKTTYTKDSLILFFIRPADNITRPCILITHGNDAQYRSSWNEQTKFIAIDLAMRGYAVAFYENPSSRDATQIRIAKNNPADTILLRTRNGLYNGFQSAVAATLFVTHNATDLKVNTAKLFAGGYSYGAFCSLSLASADAGQNFTDSLFNIQGNFTAKSIYNDTYTPTIKRAFGIGSALPKDDTLPAYNSKMGDFLDETDTGLSLLFLHGRNDYFIYFGLNKLTDSDTSHGYFFAEGPNAMINNIREKNLPVETKLIVNCKGGHNFSTSVCGYSNPYCIAQWHWRYMSEPPDTLTPSNAYFTNLTNDTLLHYISYMLTQVSDIGFMVADFLQPAVLNTSSTLSNKTYFIQPQDSFLYSNPNGHYIIRDRDCEGKPLIITSVNTENFINNKDIRVYPNPSNNFITIQAKEMIEMVKIYTLPGELVKSSAVNQMQKEIDVHDLATGEYIIVIQLADRLMNLKFSLIH
jgi:hypothetical protein